MGQTNAQKAAAAAKAEAAKKAKQEEIDQAAHVSKPLEEGNNRPPITPANEQEAIEAAERVKARADELNAQNSEAEKARVEEQTRVNSLKEEAAAHGLLPHNDPATLPTEVQDLEKRRAELEAEVAELQQKKVDAINAVVNIDATIEEQIRGEYQGGSVNYVDLSIKYRITEEEVRRIIGDGDLVDEGSSLNELPDEV